MAYDAIILGGGPAGLSAAIYLGRFMRRTIVLDSGKGRSTFGQINENYLGFPDGITTRELRRLGRKQAERFGVSFEDCEVRTVECTGQMFKATTDSGEFLARTVLFATGVTDIWPEIPNIEAWVGHQVFWCITCDGYRTLGKKIVCIGDTDEAAITALQFLRFTQKVTFISDPDKRRISTEQWEDLQQHGITIVSAKITDLCLTQSGDRICGLRLSDGSMSECDLIFSLLGVKANTSLAGELGVALDDEGYIKMDEEGYTTVPGVFAAGDLTRMYTQQVASAVHAGAEAAQTMNYFLYDDYQKNPEDAALEPTEFVLDEHDASE
jgi:thioredoxin reductase (NADPH)